MMKPRTGYAAATREGCAPQEPESPGFSRGEHQLVGDFLYLGKVNGKESFRTFTSSPLRLGNTVLFIIGV
jgi:hypothetical protein